MKRFGAALFLVLGMASVAGRAAPTGADVMVEQGILSVSGSMDAPMLAALAKQDWTGVRTIRFTSAGGWPQFSLPIARLLARTHKPILIHDLCGSACLDVLIIRHHIAVAPDTLVLLHNTPMGQALTTADYPAISGMLRKFGEAEQQWLKENGVDPRLTLIAMATTSPLCVAIAVDDPRLADQLRTFNRYDAWAPRDATLAAFGIAAVRGWKQDRRSVLRIMHARFPAANLARLRAADEPMAFPDMASLTAGLQQVRACAARPLQLRRAIAPGS